MAKPVVFLTRHLPEPVMTQLKRAFDLRYPPEDHPLSKEDLRAGMQNADGMVSMLSDPITRELIEAASRLKIIANYAVGYNNIDLAAARDRGIVVTNTPGVLTETTADLTWALLLAAARRIPEGDRRVKSGKWDGWAPKELLGYDIHRKTLGIVGMGRIGQAVARRAAGFSMHLLYFSRTRLSSEREKALQAAYLPLDRLLAQSDFVSLHLPLNGGSRRLIGKEAFQTMKRSAILINTARGAIVDEAALVDALRNRRIAAAGLDVYEAEPVVPPALRRLDNVVILPHIGSATAETRIRMGEMVLANLAAFFANQQPPNVVHYS